MAKDHILVFCTRQDEERTREFFLRGGPSKNGSKGSS
jgi:hypothetical protein